MKFCQLQAMLFSVVLINIACCLSSTASPWNKRDGMKLVVPRRMAKLLKKITKQKLDQEGSDNYDLQTTLKLMSLNGIRNRNELRSSATGNTSRPENEGSIRRRQRRSIKKNNVPSTCHSGKVYVNLTKYSNIIAPLGFHTHYCGQTFLLPVGNDPIVQILSQAIVNAFNSVKKFSAKVLANPRCCVPKKVHDLYVLYTVGSTFSTIRSIPNVKAGHCVCKNN